MGTDEKLLAKFIGSHASEVAQQIEALPEKEVASLLASFSTHNSVLLLSHMDRFVAARSLGKMDLKIAINLIEKLQIETAEQLLRQLDAATCNAILEGLHEHFSTPLRQILGYPKTSVGAFVDPMAFTLFEDRSIKQGVEKIKKSNLYIGQHVFILSRSQSLIGFIELQQLITNDADKQISSIVKTQFPKILADMNISVISEIWKLNESFSQLPVVDASGIFMGTISRDALSKDIKRKSAVNLHARKTSDALGDLYKIGLSSLFISAAEIVGTQNPK